MLSEVVTYALLIGVGLLTFAAGPAILRALAALFEYLASPAPDFVHRRGARLGSHEEANSAVNATAHGPGQDVRDFPGIAWGGLLMPLPFAWNHFLLQGMPGSGKTVLLKVMLDSILPLVGRRGAGFRAVIADPKREMAALVHQAVALHVPVWDLNAFSSRGVAWAIGFDVATPAEADQCADTLIPEDKSDVNPFFRNNARAALRALISVLQALGPKKWTLRDLILLCRTRELLMEVLELCPHTRSVAAQVFTNKKTGNEIISTIGSKLCKFETVAACWDRAPRAVSLRRFLDSEEVLLLGYDDAISAPLMALYPLMTKFLQDWILARNDPGKPVFVVIDEFRLFGKCDLVPLAIKGREARAALVIAFQDVNGVEALLGEKEARELLGCLQSKGFLAADSEAATKFASETLGKEEGWEYTTNVTRGSGNSSTTKTERITQREVVMPDQIRNLPLASWERDAVEGYFKSPFTGRYHVKAPFRDVVERLRPPADFPRYAQRPADEQRLRPLTEADYNRLNIPVSPAIRATL